MDLVGIVNQWGVALVFVVVLIDLAGLPLPAPPLLLVAGALSIDGSMRPDLLLFSAVAASLLADHAWFLVGRRHGRRLLATICRISLSPDICVSRTDALLGKYGPALLLFAKFVPGVSAVSIPTLAAMGVRYWTFLRFDLAGCLIWCGAYIGAGAIFSHEVDRLLTTMHLLGAGSLAVATALLALYVGARYLQRRRLMRLHDLVRIAPGELAALLNAGEPIAIVDARSALARSSDPRVLPRSVMLEDPRAIAALPAELRAQTVVTFCTCPNEASAAFVAELLMKAGYAKVRVLTGGVEALDVLAARG